MGGSAGSGVLFFHGRRFPLSIGGISYGFAEGTVIPARGYLVVAKDPAALLFGGGDTSLPSLAQAYGTFAGMGSQAGQRLRLHPDDYYALGTRRGSIKERWFSSVIPAMNGPGSDRRFYRAVLR